MKRTKEEELITCYHCGESCDGSIIFDHKQFCCHGCQTVYEILNENNLGSYYTYNNSPGKSLKKITGTNNYAYLDDEQVKSKLISFNDGDTSIVTFYVP